MSCPLGTICSDNKVLLKVNSSEMMYLRTPGARFGRLDLEEPIGETRKYT